jgi:hypothetical protein
MNDKTFTTEAFGNGYVRVCSWLDDELEPFGHCYDIEFDKVYAIRMALQTSGYRWRQLSDDERTMLRARFGDQ